MKSALASGIQQSSRNPPRKSFASYESFQYIKVHNKLSRISKGLSKKIIAADSLLSAAWMYLILHQALFSSLIPPALNT